jgi:proteasome lid subunit RPN8/RPN11
MRPCGVWHSHPNGNPNLSRSDRESAAKFAALEGCCAMLLITPSEPIRGIDPWLKPNLNAFCVFGGEKACRPITLICERGDDY